MQPGEFTLERRGDSLNLTVGDRCYIQVECRRAFPLTRKNQYVAFFDMEEKEIGMVQDIRSLPMEIRQLVE